MNATDWGAIEPGENWPDDYFDEEVIESQFDDDYSAGEEAYDEMCREDW